MAILFHNLGGIGGIPCHQTKAEPSIDEIKV